MIEYTVNVYDGGTKHWYKNGELHREDGPAVEYVSGTKHWYKNGKLHREDGPAIEYTDGEKKWCVNGKLHREDGPACEYADGDKAWYLNGKEFTEEEFLNKTKKHTIIINGQEIQISSESFNELKKSLN